MKHRVLLAVAFVLLLAIGAGTVVAANVLAAQRLADDGRTAAQERTRGDAHGPDGEFHRFRLGSIAGERLEPNRDDYRTATESVYAQFKDIIGADLYETVLKEVGHA